MADTKLDETNHGRNSEVSANQGQTRDTSHISESEARQGEGGKRDRVAQWSSGRVPRDQPAEQGAAGDTNDERG